MRYQRFPSWRNHYNSSFYDSYTNQYFSVIVNKNLKEKAIDSNTVTFHRKRTNPGLHRLSKKTPTDIFTGWNITFDKEYFDERAKLYKLTLPGKLWMFWFAQSLPHPNHKSFNRLMDVVESEKLSVPNYEPFQNEFYEKEDFKKSLVVNHSTSNPASSSTKNTNSSISTGYEELRWIWILDSTLYHGAIIENLLLRAYHNKYVLNSKPSRNLIDDRHDDDDEEK